MEQLKKGIPAWAMPIASIVITVAITAGGAFVSAKIQAAIMEAKIATLEKDQAKHENEKRQQIEMNRARTDDHEQRIIRLEANFSIIQQTLSEMKSDLKSLIKITVKGREE